MRDKMKGCHSDKGRDAVILNVLMKDLDAVAGNQILREYAQDDGHFSSIVGVAKPSDDPG
jgi:hypothetical protein